MKKDRGDSDTYSIRKKFKKATACGSPPVRKKLHPGNKGHSPLDRLYYYGTEVGPRINGLPLSFRGLNHQQAANKMFNNWYDSELRFDNDIIQRKFDIDIYSMDKIDQLAINLPYVMNEAIGLISRSLNWEANNATIGVAIQTETLRILRGDFLYSHMLPFFTKLERILRKMSCSDTNIFYDPIRRAHIDITRMIESLLGLKQFSKHAFSTFFRDFPWIWTKSKSIGLLKKWGDTSIMDLNHSVVNPKDADSARKTIRELKQQLRSMEASSNEWRALHSTSQAVNLTLQQDLASATNEVGSLRMALNFPQPASSPTSADPSDPQRIAEIKKAFQLQLESLNARIFQLTGDEHDARASTEHAIASTIESKRKLQIHLRFMNSLLDKMAQPPANDESDKWKIDFDERDLDDILKTPGLSNVTQNHLLNIIECLRKGKETEKKSDPNVSSEVKEESLLDLSGDKDDSDTESDTPET